MRWAALVAASALGIVLLAEETFSPARFLAGTVPVVPVTALGGGQVIVELTVSEDGRVTAVTPLRTTPPFTDLVVEAVRNWQFRPAEQDVGADRDRVGVSRQMMSIESRVLLAAIFRPPVLTGPTLGEIPRDFRRASDDVAFPLATAVPPLPPMASKSGVVLLEVDVDRNGAVADVAVVQSVPSFDDAARAAVKTWKFRLAQVRNLSVPTVVYVLFGFRVPVSIPVVPRDRGR